MITDYYLALLPISRKPQHNLPNLPEDILRKIFSYNIINIMEIHNIIEIRKQLYKFCRNSSNANTHLNCISPFGNSMSIHYIPYPKILDNESLKQLIIEQSTINCDILLEFSHYCCGNTGLVFNSRS